jgi:hypothetical protein
MGELQSKGYADFRWYYRKDLGRDVVRTLADRKSELVNHYKNYPFSFRTQPEGVQYDDYSEYLWEQAMIREGFDVTGKSTHYHKGLTYIKPWQAAGRQPNLDFIAKHPEKDLDFGFSLKNKLDYPIDDEITPLLDLSDYLT